MDDDLQNLEAELKSLQPTSPSRDLLSRVERELMHETSASTGRRPFAPVRWVLFAALPIAAAVAFVVVRFSPRPGSDGSRGGVTISNQTAATQTKLVPDGASLVSDAPLKPVAAENVLVSARDEGVVTLEDGTPARRERLQYVDTITWKNPRTNASLTWRVPREEVRVIPISFQ